MTPPHYMGALAMFFSMFSENLKASRLGGFCREFLSGGTWLDDSGGVGLTMMHCASRVNRLHLPSQSGWLLGRVLQPLLMAVVGIRRRSAQADSYTYTAFQMCILPFLSSTH